MASNAAALSGLAPASTTSDLPDVSPLTKGQVAYTAIVALLAWTFAVYDLITFGNLLPKIQQEFGWSNATASYVATFVGLASLVVALSVGPVIDRLGRRFALVLTTGGAALSSGLAAFAIGPLSLIVFRALSGFGMSEQAVNAAYLNEVFGPRAKGFLYGIVQAGWPLGVMLSSALAALLLPQLGWRGVFVVATFPLIVMLVLRFGLRESPYFVKIKHLRRLRAQGDDAACDQLARQWSLDIAGDRPNTYAELLTPSLRRQSIALGAMFFFRSSPIRN
jgi:MFS family permease